MELTSRHRWTLCLVLMGLLGFISWQLIKLPLWGHWCLPWFIFAWLLIVVLTSWKTIDNPNSRKLLGLSTLTGIGLFLGFPTMPLTPLLFLAFIPLLLVLKNIRTDGGKHQGRRVLFYSYNAFILWNILSTFWVGNTAFIAGIVAIGLNSFFMASIFWVFYKVQDKFSKGFQYWTLAALWISFEYLHLHWEISWSWLTLGNAFAQTPQWIQWYEYTGVFGGTLWIWTLNILGFQLFEQWQLGSLPKQKLNIGIFIGLFLSPILFSKIIYWNYEETGTSFTVASVQPNFEPHYEKFTIPIAKQNERFIQLSQSCLNNETDLLLFPETSFGYFDVDLLDRYPVNRKLFELIQDYPKVGLITGTATYRIYEDLPVGKDLTQIQQNDGTLVYRESQNSATYLKRDNSYEVYLKSKFVPGAEIFPYKKFLPFLRPLVNKLGGSLSDWGSQEKRSVFNVNNVSVAPIICYESVFGEYVAGYIRQGAKVLVVVTNDGWWDNTMGHKQHGLFSRLRAIEYRRPVVRSANLGWSCFINQRGDISLQNEYGVMGCVQSTVLANDEITVYAKWGDMIARIAGFMVLLILASASMSRYRKK